jgi:hypothetical protein
LASASIAELDANIWDHGGVDAKAAAEQQVMVGVCLSEQHTGLFLPSIEPQEEVNPPLLILDATLGPLPEGRDWISARGIDVSGEDRNEVGQPAALVVVHEGEESLERVAFARIVQQVMVDPSSPETGTRSAKS